MERLNALAGFDPGHPADQHPQTQAWLDGDHRVHPPVFERPFG